MDDVKVLILLSAFCIFEAICLLYNVFSNQTKNNKKTMNLSTNYCQILDIFFKNNTSAKCLRTSEIIIIN